jgi:hypothetical protein
LIGKSATRGWPRLGSMVWENRLRDGRDCAARLWAIPAACDIRCFFAYTVRMWDPFAPIPRMNRTLVYLGACIIAGLRLAREKQVNVRVIPTSTAIEESVDLAHEIFNRVFRRVPDRVEAK